MIKQKIIPYNDDIISFGNIKQETSNEHPAYTNIMIFTSFILHIKYKQPVNKNVNCRLQIMNENNRINDNGYILEV